MTNILAVDLGNFNVKTSEEVIFQSRFREVQKEFITGECLLFNNKLYEMEIGSFDNTFNKAQKNYLPNLLYAIYKSVREEISSINLVLGVPASNGKLGVNFKNELEGKTFNYSFGNNERIVNIEKVATVAEGLSSFYTLSKEERKKDTVIIDIGGRTVNVCSFLNGKNIEKFTIPQGTIDIYNEVANNYNSNGNNATVEESIRLLRGGFLEAKTEKNNFIIKMLNSIKLRINDIETYNIYLTGGGSLEIETELKEYIKNYKYLDDPIFSNVKGNKAIASIKWR